jgi:hypothetical protein
MHSRCREQPCCPAQPLRVVNVIPFADRKTGGRPSVSDQVAEILDKLYAANKTLIDQIDRRVFKSLAHAIRKEAGKGSWGTNATALANPARVDG